MTQAPHATLNVTAEFAALYPRCQPCSMVDVVKQYALYQGVCHVLAAGVPGAMVECGVWKGGCCMLMALTAQAQGAADRDIYLYDTFAGMSQPGAVDVSHTGAVATPQWQEKQTATHNQWCYAALEEVKQNLATTGYEEQRLHFVPGRVEDTIPGTVPDKIAVLRLDTDWYESTYHELVHLYPRLSANGILILDDFFYWQGQRKAVERYFSERRIDMTFYHTTTGVIGTKPLAA